MGVQEYRIRPDNATMVNKDGTPITTRRKDSYLGREWILYDVGGCRSSVSSTRFVHHEPQC